MYGLVANAVLLGHKYVSSQPAKSLCLSCFTVIVGLEIEVM